MTESNRRATPRSPRGPGVAGATTLMFSLAAGVALVGLTAAAMVAKTIVTPPRRRVEDIRVEQYWETDTGKYVKLAGTSDARLGGAPGRYSFWFDDDHGLATLGEIVDQSWDTVTRRVLNVYKGDLSKTRRGRINGWVWMSPADLGLPFEEIELEAPLGTNPAWSIPAAEASDTWVIHIHGRGSQMAETLRGVIPVRENGANSLVISYRNDGDATPTADGKYSLGATEWLDVETAMRYALDHGAKHILLFGWSMGGAIALQTLGRSRLAFALDGLILDSPVVDWQEALRYQSDAVRLPVPVQQLVLKILGSRWGRPLSGKHDPIDLASLNWITRADELTVPVLVMHSDDDGFVPAGPSREFAAARPDLVTFVPFEKARHCKLWNYDEHLYETSITNWMRGLRIASAHTDSRTPRQQSTRPTLHAVSSSESAAS